MGCIQSTRRSANMSSYHGSSEGSLTTSPQHVESTSQRTQDPTSPQKSPKTLLTMSRNLLNQLDRSRNMLEQHYDALYQAAKNLCDALKLSVEGRQEVPIQDLSAQLTRLQQRFNGLHYAALVDAARAADIIHH